MKIAVIPARGGSKRIPKKNIKLFCGQPIISYSIKAALESKEFDMVIVSTDTEEIAEVAKAYGADVPFLRPKEIADDFSGTNAVIAHAVDWVEQKREMQVSFVCCIYATSVFLSPNVIRKGFELISSNNECEYAVTVTHYATPVQKALQKESGSDFLTMREVEYADSRTQDLLDCYHDAAQMYWGRPDVFRRDAKVFAAKVLPVVVPRTKAQDIDTEEDWVLAEALYRAFSQENT